jgi:uncharacterized protein (TIGR03118 family)
MCKSITSHHNLALAIGAALLLSAAPASAQTRYNQVNLVSNIPGQAAVTDSSLVNPWGLAASTGSPWWVADNGADLSTLYNGNNGAKQGLVVSIPDTAPTGIVSNSTPDFLLPGTVAMPVPAKAAFIFATETGSIDAWNGAQGTTAINRATVDGAVFKGLAIGTANSASYLYAADFTQGKVQVFNSTFGTTNTLTGNFTDLNLPAGYAPFGIQNLGGKIYVTYAQQSGGHDEVDGPGKGFVDVFDTNGNLLNRVASGGTLNAPWGLALAPSDFGDFSNDLLVGNFGDGTINAFDLNTFAFEGQLLGNDGNPLSIDGLWALAFGNGASAGPKNHLFFTAGLNGENDGLFGELDVPEPFTLSLFGAGLAGVVALRRRRKANKA